MGRIKDQNYYVTNGWMITQLGLTGRELQVYAIIYGFTQDGETEFTGSLNYIMEWLGTSSFHTALRAINSLIDKGLINKRQVEENGVKSNFYTAIVPPPTLLLPTAKTAEGTAKTAEGYCQNGRGGTAKTAEGGTAKTADNNYINKDINNYKDIILSQPPENDHEKSDPTPYEKIRKMYNDICSFSKCVSMGTNRKKALAARWKEYGGTLETFETLFRMAEASSFLKGQNDRNWSATFDWLIKSDNMAKVLEGKYKNKEAAGYGFTGTGTARAGAGYGKPAAAAADVRTTAELEAKIREQGGRVEYPDFGKIVGN